VLLGLSYLCMVSFFASGVLLGCAAVRITRGRPTFGLDSGRRAGAAALVQLTLLFGSSFAVYGRVRSANQMQTMGLTVIFVLVVYGVPVAFATYYYVSVLGGWLGKSIYGATAELPGTDIPQVGKAMALTHRGDLVGAATLLEGFLAENPGNIEGLRTLADVELRRRRFGRAAELCRRALRADSELRATKTGLAEEQRVKILSLLADALERDGRGREAAGVIEACLAGLNTQRFRNLLAERAARLRNST
jgi:hypothetical protein